MPSRPLPRGCVVSDFPSSIMFIHCFVVYLRVKSIGKVLFFQDQRTCVCVCLGELKTVVIAFVCRAYVVPNAYNSFMHVSKPASHDSSLQHLYRALICIRNRTSETKPITRTGCERSEVMIAVFLFRPANRETCWHKRDRSCVKPFTDEPFPCNI